jgi:hypothetical protein
MGLDKLSQLKKQKVLKQAEEAKSLAKKSLVNLENAGDNAVGMVEGGISNVVSIFKKPVIPQMSIKVPKTTMVKPKSNKFKIKALAESAQSAANKAQSAANSVQSGVSNVISLGKSAKSGVSNVVSLSKSAVSNAKSIKTISTIGNVSISEGVSMIKNAAGQTTETLKAANKDFLKGN